LQSLDWEEKISVSITAFDRIVLRIKQGVNEESGGDVSVKAKWQKSVGDIFKL
jgi:hypothetical protein